jgi:hypothetical protein
MRLLLMRYAKGRRGRLLWMVGEAPPGTLITQMLLVSGMFAARLMAGTPIPSAPR